MTSPRLAVLVLLLLPSALQAQHERVWNLRTLSDRPPVRRNCEVVRRPASFPPLSAYADSAAFVATLARYSSGSVVEGGPYVLYSVTVTSAGRIQDFRVIEKELPPEVEPLVTARILEGIDAARLPVGSFRMRVDLAGEPLVRLGSSLRCPPEFNTRFRLQSLPAEPGWTQPRPVRIRLDVDADGRILNVELLGSSGRAAHDRYIREDFLNKQITPGTLDGFPVRMEHEQMIRFETRG